MTNEPDTDPFAELREALRERVKIIGDHGWRDRDPNSHLEALRRVSERLVVLQREIPADALAPDLKHYLERCSYEKALAWLDAKS